MFNDASEQIQRARNKNFIPSVKKPSCLQIKRTPPKPIPPKHQVSIPEIKQIITEQIKNDHGPCVSFF